MMSFISWAQLDSILIRFNSFVEDEAIRLDWTIKGGNQCNGTVIQHSTDSILFTNIGGIPGICGSPFHDESYSYTDFQPTINGINYYRIDLVGIGYSKIISRANYNLKESQVLVLPNPIITESRIIFDNLMAEPCSLEISDLSGKIIFTDHTRSNKIQISASQFPAGIYPFLIRKNEEVLGSGRLVVQ